MLIPGLGGRRAFLGRRRTFLTDLHQVIVVDHRGGGRSDKPSGAYSIGRIANDVLQIVDSLGIESAHLAGHSKGGAVVQTIAIDNPARAKSLTISASWARPDQRFRELFVARRALMECGQADIYQRLTHVFGFTPTFIENNASSLETALSNAKDNLAPFAVTAARIQMLLDYDRAADLSKATAPALVMGSRGDIMIPFDRSEEVARLLPNGILVEMQGGHFYPREAPGKSVATLLGFLNTHAGHRSKRSTANRAAK